MRLFVTIGLLLFSALVCNGQLIDDFSDGEYFNSPTWGPDNPINWTIVGGQLRSNSAVASSTFYITTFSSQVLNAQWEFSVNLPFNTSSANFVDIFLVSSNANLTGPSVNGYFVRIGGTPDEISLYSTSNGLNNILINGTDGLTNTSNNTLKIKVTRDAANLWKLERDITGIGNSYVTEGMATDNSFTTTSFFGIRITQSTASFFSKHFFDDFYVGPIISDLTPPVLNSITVDSSTEISLLFNEILDVVSSQITSNYSVNNLIGNPVSAVLQSDLKTVKLTFNKAFANGIVNLLTLFSIKDLAGNSMASTQQNFLFFQAVPTKTKDLIITEIFADPSPQIGLPDFEYIEIFNRSANPIDMNGWKLADATTTATFASHIILPGEYWIVTSTFQFQHRP